MNKTNPDLPHSPKASDDAVGAGAAQVTQILQRRSDDATTAELLPLVYEQLRVIARGRMAGERQGHTLAATALVHEAYMRLMESTGASWRDRGHFYAAAAEAMRRILIDHARKRGSQKRGGDCRAVPLSVVDLAEACDLDTVAAIDDAITRLEAEDPRAASVVKLRFFAGLDVAATAASLELSERTVMREWAFARARLHQMLGEGDES